MNVSKKLRMSAQLNREIKAAAALEGISRDKFISNVILSWSRGKPGPKAAPVEPTQKYRITVVDETAWEKARKRAAAEGRSLNSALVQELELATTRAVNPVA